MPDDAVLIRCGTRSFMRRDVLSAADFRLELDPLRQTIRLGLIAQKYAFEEGFVIDADALQLDAEAYRLDRDLSSAEDTERWLQDRDVTADDFTAWLERRTWRARFADELDALCADYQPAHHDIDALLWPEVVFGDHLAGLTSSFAARAAALMERRGSWVGASWTDELAAMQQAFDELRAQELVPANIQRELDLRRSLLMRFRAELALFPSLDAGREAWLCVSREGEELASVAREAGVEIDLVEWFLDEFPEALQTPALSARAGEALPPVEDGGGCLVCRVLEKRLPNDCNEPEVRARIESSLIRRVVNDLLQKHAIIVAIGGPRA